MGYFIKQSRYVLRRLVRSPTFTGATLLTIAIGIGANTAIFSVINGILLKPLPYADPDTLVGVWGSAPGLNIKDLNLSPSFYFTFREQNRSFQDIGLWTGGSASVTGLAEPEQVEILSVTETTFPILGVHPILGRGFSAKDASSGSPETVMLTHAYWRRKFGGDTSVIGKTILMSGRPKQIIGVMPMGFRFLNQNPDLIVPFQFDRAKLFLGNFSYQGIARLKPGVTLAQANADFTRMIPIVNKLYPPPPGFSLKMFEEVRISPNVRPLMIDVVGDIGKVLWVLMGTIGMVLLIACANVANLLLVRAEGRQQEFAIRAALGADRSQLARELLFESIFLGLLGGAIGSGLADAALRLLIKIGPQSLPRLYNISIDSEVLLFTLAISLFAGALFGLIPIFKYVRPHVGSALHGGGRTASQSRERHRTRNTLVVAQVALALVLLVGSGLMIRTFQALQQVQPGFRNPKELQTLRLFIPEALVKEPERVARMHHDILLKISQIPGVTSAAIASGVPTDGNRSFDPIFVEGRSYAEGEVPAVRKFKSVAPGFFQTMGSPLIAGREMTWTDMYELRPVVIVSENLAREVWKDPRAAIGKRIRQTPNSPWQEVVGVARDVPDDGAHQKAPAIVYWPFSRKDDRGGVSVRRQMVYAIRSSRAGSESFLKELRESIWAVNSNLPLASVRTMEEIYRASMARTSFTLVMLAIAGGMALLLGVVGIYGVISYSVSQRTREIGIRMALGAEQRELKQMFIRHGLLLAGIGVVCGLAAAITLSRLMTSLLFEVNPLDPITYIVVSATLVMAAVAASYLPARKAATVDPMTALRAE